MKSEGCLASPASKPGSPVAGHAVLDMTSTAQSISFSRILRLASLLFGSPVAGEAAARHSLLSFYANVASLGSGFGSYANSETDLTCAVAIVARPRLLL